MDEETVNNEVQAEAQEEQGGETQEATQEVQSWTLDQINETLGGQYEDLGSLKKIVEQNSELGGELDSWKSKYSEVESKYNSFVDMADPSKVFGEGFEDVRNEFEKKKYFGEKGYDVSAVNEVMGLEVGDGNKAKINAIVKSDKLINKSSISDDSRAKAILKGMGIDYDSLDDLEPEEQYALDREFNKSNERINEVKGYKPPEFKNDLFAEKESRQAQLAEAKESRQKQWEPIVKSLIDNFKEVQLTDKNGDKEEAFFSFSVDDAFKEKQEELLKRVVDSGLEMSEENAGVVSGLIRNEYILANVNKLVRSAMNEASVKIEDKVHDEIHNDTDQNTSEAPRDAGKKVGMTLAESLRLGK